jgi:uncharacterized protein (TIGR02145 family)
MEQGHIDNAGTTFIDLGGQKYPTVEIGDLTWMAENLNYETRLSWDYGDKEPNSKKYGRLYIWEDALAACPKEWHLPSKEEWDTLIKAVGGEEIAGEKLKSETGWKDYNGKSGNGTDGIGFLALPGGDCHYKDGSIIDVGGYGYWWSATEDGTRKKAYRFGLECKTNGVEWTRSNKGYGFSVRYVKDAPRDNKKS